MQDTAATTSPDGTSTAALTRRAVALHREAKAGGDPDLASIYLAAVTALVDRHLDDHPVAMVDLVTRDRLQYWRIAPGACPFGCGRAHHHGGDFDVPPLGTRVAHCLEGDGHSYLLVPR